MRIINHSPKFILALCRNVCYQFSGSPVNKSFYRRLLPSHLIALNSHQGKKIFEESLLQKNCEAFFSLVQQFITQNEPSTCALATMAMILNSLKIDPGYNWKGIWRWFDDYNIKSLTESHLREGLTLEEFNTIIQHNHAKSMAFSPLENKDIIQSGGALRQSSLSLFRNSIIACNRRQNLFLTINFHRKSLGQTGIGHFSPIAAYNSKRDLALILDVAKFKYDSYWCSVEQIYEALKAIDTTSQQSRGYLINKKKYTEQKQPESPMCFLELDFKFNRMLRSKIYFHQKDHITFVTSLLNDEEIHPLLIPVFYQFATLDIQGKETIVENMSKHTQFHRSKIDFNSLKLSGQAKTLLFAYSKQESMSLIYFLSLVFSHRHQTPHLGLNYPSANEVQMLKLIRKCQVYFELETRSPVLNGKQ